MSNVETRNELSPVQIALSKLKDIAITPKQLQRYNKVVKIYNPAYSDEKPAFVAIPNSVDDVKRCLCVANDTGAPVAVKSGGHSFAGYSNIGNNGFVISLENMNNVIFKNDMVTVQAGSKWEDVYTKLEGSGYVAVGGCCPTVGVGGYILGGGYGLQSRAHGGLACDKAISFTMVTANGDDVVTASNEENEDLFWGLKGGGGGNFGVVVDITLKLSSSPNQFIWTKLIYADTESIERGLTLVGETLSQLPKELNLDMMLENKTLTLDAVYSDHNEELVKAILKSLQPTSITSPKTYTSFLTFVNEYSNSHGYVRYELEPIYIRGAVLKSLPSELAAYFANLEIPSNCNVTFVHMGGDIKQFSDTSTAFPYRSAEYSYYTYGRFSDSESKEEVFRFATSVYNTVKKSECALGSYINYMDRHLKNWADEYYDSNYSRLCEIKRKWNPVGTGSLHFQQEIGSSWEPNIMRH